MNTHTFGNYSVTCPICQRAGNPRRVKVGNGLFTCPYCQERLVVTWSGHYVRDPSNGKRVVAQVLRRQSSPFARILRDFGFAKRPHLLIAVGSAILLGVSAITLVGLKLQPKPVQKLLEQVKEVVEQPHNP